jgi:hypothetical protein
MSRLQASLYVAARVIAPRCTTLVVSQPFDAPLGYEGPPYLWGLLLPRARELSLRRLASHRTRGPGAPGGLVNGSRGLGAVAALLAMRG